MFVFFLHRVAQMVTNGEGWIQQMKNCVVWAQESLVSVAMGVVVLTAASVLATVGMMMTAAFVLSGGHLRSTAQHA